MDFIDVPEVYELPKLDDGLESPVELANLVLTSLLTHNSGLLHAEYIHREATVTWFIRPRREDGLYGYDIPVAVSSSPGYFRSTLARFGHRFMNDQLYGGFARLRLRQRGKIHASAIYMSNMAQSDFWIRVYATADSPAPIN